MKKVFYFLFIIASLLLISVSCSDSDKSSNNPVSPGTETKYNLSVIADPTEAGSVNPSSGEYNSGDSVEITASSNEKWVFEGWQGDHTGTANPVSITMNDDKDIVALFTERTYPLTINAEGEGTVSERVVQAKTTDYPHGTTVELTAHPAEGWEFVEWLGDLEGDVNPSTVIVDGEMSVIAVFQEAVYTIEFRIEGEGNVKIDPLKEIYEFGEIVTLAIEPAEGWSFIHWSGDLEGYQNPYEVSMSQNLNIIVVLDENPFAGGNGSMEYPFLIETIYQLQAIRNYTNKNFLQVNDIDASETEFWNEGQGFIPIGDNIIPFAGTYNGDNFTVVGLTIKRPNEQNVGIFGVNEGTINKLHLQNINIEGDTNVGAFVGFNSATISYGTVIQGIVKANGNVGGGVGINEGNISNTEVNVRVESYGGTTGGLVGRNGKFGSSLYTEIINSSTKGEVIGKGTVGGLIGMKYSGVVDNSYSESNVFGGMRVGGLIGENRRGGFMSYDGFTIVKDSYSTGDVSGGNQVGGLVGDNNGIIENSNSSGNVYGNDKVGGLIGNNVGGYIGYISNAVSLGNVEGNNDVGGLIGYNNATISNTYTDNIVTASGDNVGGLIGYAHFLSLLDQSYSTSEILGVNNVGGLIGYQNANELNGLEIVRSYFSGIVKGTNGVGGLIGVLMQKTMIKKSFSSGLVLGETDVGGLVGVNGSTIESSYWDKNASEQGQAVGRGNNSGTLGLGSEQMQGASAEENMAEFDWENIWKTTSGYPILRWQE